jgi:flagellar basal-body rod protein FlgG
MVRGLYTAATGMNLQAKRLDVISNDLANANTIGYKKDVAVAASFPEVLTSRLNDSQNNVNNSGPMGVMTLGVNLDQIYTQFAQGSLRQSTSQTDFAIEGDGFFTVLTPAGQAYTRDGSFIISNEGLLVTQEGYNVMGQNGPVELGEEFLTFGGSFAISPEGEVSLNGEVIDLLNLVSFEDNQALQKMGDNLYDGAGAAQIAFNGRVTQGFLEMSNVNSVTAMVDMIAVSRAYETNQKMIQTQDSLLAKAVNEVGRA